MRANSIEVRTTVSEHHFSDLLHDRVPAARRPHVPARHAEVPLEEALMSSNRSHSLLTPGRRLAAIAAALLLVAPATVRAQAPEVRLVEDASGWTLKVDGEPFMVLGMNWDYFPIGQNYAYAFWSEPDEMIIAALDREMTLLQSMGVNTIRQYVGVPPRWVQYIYERYGIFTVLNHAVGRYGVTVD
jgi:hypothetical protein